MKFKEFLEVLEEFGLEVESIIRSRNSAWTHDIKIRNFSVFLRIDVLDFGFDDSVFRLTICERKADMVIRTLNWPENYIGDLSCQICPVFLERRILTHFKAKETIHYINNDRLQEVARHLKRML